MAAVDEVVVKVTGEQEIDASPTPVVPEKAKKVVARKPRVPPAHPPYFEMISEALTTLKEKNGSSQYAIQKFIEENHKKLPSNFRKLLLVSLRKFVASGRLVKVKASFKLPSKATVSTPKAAKTTSTATAAKPKKKVAAPKKKTVTAAAKPKAKVAKPKAKAKAKAKPVVAGKPKAKAKTVAAPAKVAGTKRKAVAAVKPKAKVAKTAAKATPSKKAAPAAAKKAAPAAKKVAVKSVKPKSVKAAPKRALSTRGKK